MLIYHFVYFISVILINIIISFMIIICHVFYAHCLVRFNYINLITQREKKYKLKILNKYIKM